MNHHIQFTPQALEDLGQLDTPVAKRIIEKIQWLAEHFDQIQPETLAGAFANLYKLRVGHWRILYTIDSTQSQLTIHVIAHRRKVYKPDFSTCLSNHSNKPLNTIHAAGTFQQCKADARRVIRQSQLQWRNAIKNFRRTRSAYRKPSIFSIGWNPIRWFHLAESISWYPPFVYYGTPPADLSTPSLMHTGYAEGRQRDRLCLSPDDRGTIARHHPARRKTLPRHDNMAHAATERMAKDFSWRTSAEAYRRMYRTLAGKTN